MNQACMVYIENGICWHVHFFLDAKECSLRNVLKVYPNRPVIVIIITPYIFHFLLLLIRTHYAIENEDDFFLKKRQVVSWQYKWFARNVFSSLASFRRAFILLFSVHILFPVRKSYRLLGEGMVWNRVRNVTGVITPALVLRGESNSIQTNRKWREAKRCTVYTYFLPRLCWMKIINQFHVDTHFRCEWIVQRWTIVGIRVYPGEENFGSKNAAVFVHQWALFSSSHLSTS